MGFNKTRNVDYDYRLASSDGRIKSGLKAGDYKVTNFQSLPDEAQSLIAEKKTEEIFPNEQGTPGILVFHNENTEISVPMRSHKY